MKKYIILGIIFAVIITAVIIGWLAFFKTAGQEAMISVAEGEGTRTIAQDLKDKNVIFSPLIFSAYVYERHMFLQSGEYKITSQMTMPQIAQMMNEGKVQEYVVTIPEGYRLTQIDALLAKKGVIKSGDLTRVASADEGYLFPDTYKFPLDVTAKEIRELMLKNFTDKTAVLQPTRDQIILASIIEREAKFDEDRAKIAGVYYNRLGQNMKLEADPTVQYAKGSWDSITTADYHNVNSPYNTYLNAGLPPGPICNPGLKSIQAAMNPQKDGWLYFLTKPDGHAVFAQTLDEQEANIKKYR